MTKTIAPVGTEINIGDSIHAATRYMVAAEQAPAVFRKLASPARFFIHVEAIVRDNRGDRIPAHATFKVPRTSAMDFIKEACARGGRIAIVIYKESPHLAFIG